MNSIKYIYQTLIVFFMLLFFMPYSYAQEADKEFKFRYDQSIKTNDSRYQYIEVVDSRADSSHFGVVQKGLLKKVAKVIANPPIAEQLNSYLKSIVAQPQGSDTLVFQIRRLSFSEGSGSFTEKGFFNLRANLYQKKGPYYYPIQLIDSNFQVSGIDVTNKLLNKGSKIIDDFIRHHLNSKVSDERLTYDDVLRIDYKEKEHLPFYAAEHLVDGIYMDYKQLKNQQPKYPLLDERNKKGKFKYYYFINEKNKKIKLQDNDIYAVVENDKTYISTESGYYELYMENDEYYFNGMITTGGNSFFSIGTSVGFGSYGGFGMSSIGASFGGSRGSNQSDYKVKIDHIDGKFEKITAL